jgi:hypothetical protein
MCNPPLDARYCQHLSRIILLIRWALLADGDKQHSSAANTVQPIRPTLRHGRSFPRDPATRREIGVDPEFNNGTAAALAYFVTQIPVIDPALTPVPTRA